MPAAWAGSRERVCWFQSCATQTGTGRALVFAIMQTTVQVWSRGEGTVRAQPKSYPFIAFRFSSDLASTGWRMVVSFDNEISVKSIQRRRRWVDEIIHSSGDFGRDLNRIETEITHEIQTEGVDALIDHLHLCGAIPEVYVRDSSEEKLYSKYTDILLAETFRFLGLRSQTLSERADAADVEVVGKTFDFVADAKAFRLSRTAKNQKDFKVQAMDQWKHGRRFAVIVCPIYQLPAKTSQIYQQAIARNVCILSYSHLSTVVIASPTLGVQNAQELLGELFASIESLNPSKDAVPYWRTINRTLLDYNAIMGKIWRTEKIVSVEAIKVAKKEALTHLNQERQRFLKMSHQDTIENLIRAYNIDGRKQVIDSVSENQIMAMI